MRCLAFKNWFSRLFFCFGTNITNPPEVDGLLTESPVQQFQPTVLMLHFQKRWRNSRLNCDNVTGIENHKFCTFKEKGMHIPLHHRPSLISLNHTVKLGDMFLNVHEHGHCSLSRLPRTTSSFCRYSIDTLYYSFKSVLICQLELAFCFKSTNQLDWIELLIKTKTHKYYIKRVTTCDLFFF